KPEHQVQRLHLLIVRAGDEDGTKLTQRVLDALQPAKECLVQVHGPFTGEIKRGQVLAELRRVKQQIDLQARKGQLNNVVVVYYQGTEAINDMGHFFTTTPNPSEANLRQQALTCDSLAAHFEEIVGAQVLLLDVNRAKGREERPGDDKVAF